MRIRTHIGMSLDGLVTSADGLPAWDWSPSFHSDGAPQGYPEFMANVGGVIIGRTSFEQGLPHWSQGWPWGDRPIVVLTHRPLHGDVPPSVEAASSPQAAVDTMLAAGVTNDVQLLGGSGAVQSFMQAGLLDELGLVILPVLLGSGIPMFHVEEKQFSPEVWQASPKDIAGRSARTLKLESQRTFPDGAVWMVYAAK